jgi:hypothetical protein
LAVAISLGPEPKASTAAFVAQAYATAALAAAVKQPADAVRETRG